MSKFLGLDETQIYCNDFDQYFYNFDQLFKHLEWQGDQSEGKTFEITILRFKKIQYWFPNVEYILKQIAHTNKLPLIDEIIQDIYKHSDIDFEEFKDFEELAGQNQLQKALDHFKQSQNPETLQEALEFFRSANEDFYYLVPDTSNPEIHCFVFKQDKLTHLGLKQG